MDIIPVCCRISRLPFWRKCFVGTPCAMRVGCGLWIFGPPYYFLHLFVLGWRQLISWLYFTEMNNRSHVSIFSHREYTRTNINWCCVFGMMYCTEPTISFNMNMCRGALVDIASVEVTQPTQCQSELMAGCLLRCLSWHRVGRGAPADVMSVWIHGCLCMKEQKVKDDVSNTSHNDKT